MCLAVIAINQHPLYPVIILSNRDEFYARDSAPADFWDEDANVFAGKDLIGHGSWLGINKSKHFAFVTNYRDPKAFKSCMQSRGLLVSNYLLKSATSSSMEYLERVKASSTNYNNFNLILGDPKNVYYYSSIQNEITQLTTGLYGISNHLLDTPWYKMERAKKLFIENLYKLIGCDNRDTIHELLFDILSDRTLSPDDLLPHTGVSEDLEKSLSSIFVNIPEHKYGTYSSSIILFEKNNISFAEKIYKDGNFDSLRQTDIVPI